jgi:SAM-dependent methyltransferase
VNSGRDPGTPSFWDTLFRDKRTPWDAGSTPLELKRYLDERNDGGRVLIPGCGSGHEVRAFSEKGGYEVTAIDFSTAAVERARSLLGEWQRAVVLGDFFSCDFGGRPFDVIYERAFLASLPRPMWRDYARRVTQLLRPGGRLIGFFVYGGQQGGPPFCLKTDELDELLGDNFDRITESAVSASVAVFEGKERWEVWVRGR